MGSRAAFNRLAPDRPGTRRLQTVAAAIGTSLREVGYPGRAEVVETRVQVGSWRKYGKKL
jgi:hypothetical protein